MWLFSAIFSLLTTNLIFTRALGTSTMLTASRSRSGLLILSLMMTGFSAVSCLAASFLYAVLGLTALLRAPYMLVLPLLYTVMISLLYILILLVCRKRSWFGSYRNYIHLSVWNCAVMGTMYLAFAPVQTLGDRRLPGDMEVFGMLFTDFSPLGALLFGLQSGLGFLLAAVMLAAVRKRLYDSEVPAAFRGFPAVMVYIGLLSMAVYAIGSQ